MIYFTRTAKAHLLMLTWAVLIATSFPAAAAVAGKIDATSITALRFLMASVFFFVFILVRREYQLPNVKNLLCYGVLSFCLVLYFWSMFKALGTTTALNTGTLFTLVPAFTALISHKIFKTKVERQVGLALLLGAIGATWAVLKGDVTLLLTLKFNMGDGIFILGCVSLSFYGPFVNFFKRNGLLTASSVAITFWIMLIGCAMLLTITLIEQKGDLGWQALNRKDVVILLYLAIFTTVITFWQVQYCMPILSATVVMSYSFLVPSIVLLVDVLAFSQKIQPAVYIGVALTFFALLIINDTIKYFSIKFRKESQA